MKKITIVAFCLFSAISFTQTVDFESHSLSPESYDNGSGGGGDFSFDYLTFTNYYDTQWGSWNGFSISNVTDNTTAGFMNQYGSYAAGGNNSSNFAVFYPTGTISASNGGVIESFYITNTSYTAISMRDGDSFSKQFGSPNDASGTPDGTNGEDYFRVWIIVENFDQTVKDSLLFYLADYQFPNSNDDYIVDTWELIDLTTLSVPATTVSFRFESSDVGQWGINTPTYFAIDDVNYAMPLSINEVEEESLMIYPNPASENVQIKGHEGSLSIVDMSGTIVYQSTISGVENVDISDLNYGIYTVIVSNEVTTSRQKLIVH